MLIIACKWELCLAEVQVEVIYLWECGYGALIDKCIKRTRHLTTYASLKKCKKYFLLKNAAKNTQPLYYI